MRWAIQEKEIEEYMARLYKVQSKNDRTPYNYVAFGFRGVNVKSRKAGFNERVKFSVNFKGGSLYLHHWAIIIPIGHWFWKMMRNYILFEKQKYS